MTELDRDPLTAAFDEFRGRVAPFVKPAGADRTREAMRTRTRRRGVAGVLAVLVIMIPLTAQAFLKGDRQGLPAAPPTVFPGPQPSASGANFSGIGKSAPPANSAPEGGITEAALHSAQIDMPVWPAEWRKIDCPSGPVKFTGGDAQGDRITLWIAGVAHADVDRDGRAETFARVYCRSSFETVSRVLALAPEPGGGIRTIGPVVEQVGSAAAICGVRAGSDGAIQVEIADFPMAWRCAEPQVARYRYISRQWLTFTWSGSGFVQQGETDLTPNPYHSDLEVTGTDLVLTKQANGHLTGSMTLTIRNLGRSAIPYQTQTALVAGMKLIDTPPGCSMGKPNAGMVDVLCTGAELAPGSTRELTLNVDAPRRTVLDFVPSTELLPLTEGFSDPDESNNNAPLTIEFRD
jgi:hypothetical protein